MCHGRVHDLHIPVRNVEALSDSPSQQHYQPLSITHMTQMFVCAREPHAYNVRTLFSRGYTRPSPHILSVAATQSSTKGKFKSTTVPLNIDHFDDCKQK